MGARSRLRECPGGRAHARISSDSPRSTKTDGLFGGWCSLMRTSLPCRNSPDQQGKNREFREFRLWSQTQGGKKLRLYAGFRADSLFDHKFFGGTGNLIPRNRDLKCLTRAGGGESPDEQVRISVGPISRRKCSIPQRGPRRD
jgi:hypothetical protein